MTTSKVCFAAFADSLRAWKNVKCVSNVLARQGAPIVRLHKVEGTAFEKLVGILYEERSRRGVGDWAV